jgi:sugar diacid utilization regulator
MGAEPLPAGALTPSGVEAVDRLRGAHQELVDAALAGAGIERIAELASAQVGCPVAITVPQRGVAAVWPRSAESLAMLERYEESRIDGRPAEVPVAMELVVPIMSDGEIVGSVAMLAGGGTMQAEASEFLHLAALATVTALALEDAREGEALSAAELLGAIRRGTVEAPELERQAARLRCDLVHGAVVLVCDARSKPREAIAVMHSNYAGALADVLDDHVYCLLPARRGEGAPEATLDAALELARRLNGHGKTGISSFYQGSADLGRAMHEAELVLGVVSSDERMAEQLNGHAGSGVYRLLFRALVSHPEEVRSFYDDTVAAVVAYDGQYRGDLLATLESYLAHDCNMNATARSIYAHRHTVAYRLQRIKELTGLDPMVGEDRERLGLGLKAYKIVAPSLPR